MTDQTELRSSQTNDEAAHASPASAQPVEAVYTAPVNVETSNQVAQDPLAPEGTTNSTVPQLPMIEQGVCLSLSLHDSQH